VSADGSTRDGSDLRCLVVFRAVFAVCVALAGCGDDGVEPVVDASVPALPDAVAPARVEQRVIELGAGESAEARLDVPFGDRAGLRFVAAGGVVVWDVHRHDQDEAIVLMEGEGADVDETYEATTSGDVHVSWTNSGAGPISVDITLSLYGEAVLVEWYL
jgi:hypothetical protein